MDVAVLTLMILINISFHPLRLPVAISLVLTTVGLLTYWFHAPITEGLNSVYRVMPGRFQYPRGYVRVIGGILAIFGLLGALAAAILDTSQ
jgi:hypothetical protein